MAKKQYSEILSNMAQEAIQKSAYEPDAASVLFYALLVEKKTVKKIKDQNSLKIVNSVLDDIRDQHVAVFPDAVKVFKDTRARFNRGEKLAA